MHSYIEIPVEQARVLAEKFLKLREERIQKEKESMILAKMNTRPFWRPWKKRSRDEAIAALQCDPFHQYNWIGISSAANADKIEDLYSLLKLARPNSMVKLSSRVAYILNEQNP